MDRRDQQDSDTGEPTIDMGMPILSVVIPVYNEAGSLPELYARLHESLEGYGKPYEIVFVDDGSTDGSFEQLVELHGQDPRVRVIRFVRNFGQQMAVLAGLRQVRGEVVVLIDADLQTWPEDIPLLVEKLEEGHDLVFGLRQNRADSLVRRMGSRFVGWLLRKYTGLQVPDSSCGFIAVRRNLLEAAVSSNEKSRLLLATLAWLAGGKAASVPVRHAARKHGETKYSMGQLVGLTLNLICSYSSAPLRLSLLVGIFVALLSGGAFVWFVSAALFDVPGPHGSAWFLGAEMGFLGGLQLIFIGIVGEYLARVYRETRDQPLYVVGEILE